MKRIKVLFQSWRVAYLLVCRDFDLMCMHRASLRAEHLDAILARESLKLSALKLAAN